jgi:hypothetical protein
LHKPAPELRARFITFRVGEESIHGYCLFPVLALNASQAMRRGKILFAHGRPVLASCFSHCIILHATQLSIVIACQERIYGCSMYLQSCYKILYSYIDWKKIKMHACNDVFASESDKSFLKCAVPWLSSVVNLCHLAQAIWILSAFKNWFLEAAMTFK